MTRVSSAYKSGGLLNLFVILAGVRCGYCFHSSSARHHSLRSFGFVLKSNSNAPDEFFGRFLKPKKQLKSETKGKGFSNSENPQQFPREEPGQPLAPAPAPVASEPQKQSTQTPAGLGQQPSIASLQPDEFGQDWSQNLGSQHTNNLAKPTTVQGNSRTTWAGLTQDSTRVQLGSQGRPVSANVEVWSGPNNIPSKMKIYSEDGATRPWNAAFATTTTSGGAPSLDVKNTGSLEYPMEVKVTGNQLDDSLSRTTNPSPASITDQKPPSKAPGIQRMSRTDKWDAPVPSQSETILGGSLGYFSFGPQTQRIRVQISSDGLPIYANVELWQGPGNIKQVAEIYTDQGLQRPWSALIETPGYQCTLAVSNVGPMEYPLTVNVEAIDEEFNMSEEDFGWDKAT